MLDKETMVFITPYGRRRKGFFFDLFKFFEGEIL